VLVGQRHDVGGDGALVGLLKTREREGTRLEKTRGGVGHGGRLMRMQRAAVVLGRAVLVSAAHVSAVWPLGVAAMSVPAGRKALVASSPQSAPRNGVEVLDEVLWRGCHLERGRELDLLGGIRRGVAGRKGSGGANCRPGMSAQDGGGPVRQLAQRHCVVVGWGYLSALSAFAVSLDVWMRTFRRLGGEQGCRA
jgi:hypothetical protein